MVGRDKHQMQLRRSDLLQFVHRHLFEPGQFAGQVVHLLLLSLGVGATLTVVDSEPWKRRNLKANFRGFWWVFRLGMLAKNCGG